MSDHVTPATSRLADPDQPPSVCDYCEGKGWTYAQNTAPVHVHDVGGGEFRQWPARPVVAAEGDR